MITINGTFIFALISFIIFLFIMKYLLFLPLNKVIEQREEFYEKNANTVKESKSKTALVLAEKEREISSARAQASNLIKEVNLFAKKESQETIAKAKQNATATLLAQEQTLDEQSAKAKDELRGEVEQYVKNIVEKVLQKEVEIHLSQEKIDEILNSKGGQNA